MAPSSTSSNLTGPCEKVFGAVIGTTAVREMRRILLMVQHPNPHIPSASPLPISNVVPANGEANGVVPVMFVPADEGKKSKVEMSHVPQLPSAKEGRAKHKANTEPPAIIKNEEDMARPERQMPKVEALAPQLPLQGKPESKVEQQAKPVTKQREKESNRGLYHMIDHRSAAYIDRAWLKIRGTSDVGKSNPGADDSIAKMKGKSASFEK